MKRTASLLLLRRPADVEVFCVERADHDRFLSRFTAFPGGAVEPEDAGLGEGLEDGADRVAALRETYEETGYLPGVRLDPAWRRAVRAGDRVFAELLAAEGVTLDLDALVPAGCWVAPPYLVTRLETRFYARWVPDDAAPAVDPADPELRGGGWRRPGDVLAAWARGEVLLAPPTRALLAALVDGAGHQPLRFLDHPAARGEVPRISPVRPHITLFPVRTPTLPPATHTNCYVVGDDVLMVFDPASPYPAERAALDQWLDARTADGAQVAAVVLTHHHHDHVGGAVHLATRLGVPIMAHAETAARLDFAVDGHLDEGGVLTAGRHRLRVLHTPGHAPGHLCFIDEATGTAIVGDMVAGIGTILVEPGEGDMGLYLDSLRRLRALAPSALLPSHGPVIGGAEHKLTEYIEHRLGREAKVVAALVARAADLPALLERVYDDVPPPVRATLGRLSLLAHLDKLVAEGRARALDGNRWALT